MVNVAMYLLRNSFERLQREFACLARMCQTFPRCKR
jgi:hypothetical protein